MASYQIYIPGARGASPDRLTEVGLDVHDAQASVEAIEVFHNGPDAAQGGSGCGVCFFWLDPEQPEFNPRPGVHPGQQEWTPAKASGKLPAGRFWMGRELAYAVEPASLLRKSHETSTPVELADGQIWYIPAVRRLPCKFALDDRGNPARRIEPRYEWFYQQAEAYLNLFLTREPGSAIEIEQAWPFALRALSMNYRVDANIVDWLGLLNDLTIVNLIGATFEWTTLERVEAQKKKA
jgi:hypothetical protein